MKYVFLCISMLSIISSCMIYVRLLFIYSDMKYVWTCYNVKNILLACHCYDNIYVFFVWVVINLNNRLAKAHARAAFRSTKSTSHINVSLLEQLKVFDCIVSFIFQVYFICYLTWFMTTMIYCFLNCFYSCLGIFNTYIILCECCFIDDFIFANASVLY